ncbi:MAG: polyamine aminopropyltransferase [Alphaproteobacteria bacterium]|nr:polyamine aminopropyltransferase [Alphaproteobacteria bacterium]
MSNKKWYKETLHENVRVEYAIDNVLFQDKTQHQDMILFENKTFGRMLALDGVIQTTQKDEPCYHEMLTHTPILAHGNVKNILIIGGGDGGIARECLKHKNINVTMVELDSYVTDFSKKHLPTLSNDAFDNEKLELIFQDGCEFVKQHNNKYDIIIVDSTDPIGVGEVLFTEEFYKDCKNCLTEGGILVSQQGVPMLQGDEIINTKRRQQPHFADVRFYKTAVSTYFGGFMTLGWATDNIELHKIDLQTIQTRFKQAGLNDLQYYTPNEHIASFSLPQFILNILKKV